MMRPVSRVISLLLVLFTLSASTVFAADESSPATLSFAERVTCTEKVEDVYWTHRIWPESNPGPKPPRTEIVSRRQIADKVERALRYEAALADLRGSSLTHDEIQTEIDRITRSTLNPSLLRDVFAALDHDPYLIAECYLRPRLAERTVRELFAWNPEIHRQTLESAKEGYAALTGARSSDSPNARRTEVHWVLQGTAIPDEKAAKAVELTPLQWQDLTAQMIHRFDGTTSAPDDGRERELTDVILHDLVSRGYSSLTETIDAFQTARVLSAGDGALHTASIRWPKQSFESWLVEISRSLAPLNPLPAGQYSVAPISTKQGCIDDQWATTASVGGFQGRVGHSGVWTGTEMIIWGGSGGDYFNNGNRYDPATDAWTYMTNTGAPAARTSHLTVWTGTEMIIWGGASFSLMTTGGRYNPATDSWVAISTTGVPQGRDHAVAVWSGSEMVVWGGRDYPAFLDSGGRYDPATDTWSNTSTTDVPAARESHRAVWTGSEMILWGGQGSAGYLDTGARYDPVADSWTSMTTTDVPEERAFHTCVWTGDEMIMWGGGPSNLDTGGRYDPVSDSWTALPTANAPSARYLHSAVWTGTEMVVWGGSYPNTNTGGRYRPVSNSWTTTTTTNAPSARYAHTAVWADSTLEMIVWGGSYPNTNTGGRYCASRNFGIDFGDAPEPTYPTLLASDGARHTLDGILFLGSSADEEADGQPTVQADGDDTDVNGDDEDGVTFASILNPGGGVTVNVDASTTCFLNTWIDFNADGDWDDVGEQVFTDEALVSGINSLTISVPLDATVGTATVARFRVDSTGGLLPTGAASDGEVEDHLITIEELDFGDAPDPTYPTLLASNGARHLIGGSLYLGAAVDADPDGQPSATANGDDTDAQGDDEDGVAFTSMLIRGQTANVQITSSSAGFVDAWIDFNADGDWADPGEQIFTGQAVVAGPNDLGLTVPADAFIGVPTSTRFRLSSAGGLSFDGLAPDGEVEDHQVIIDGLDFGDAPDPGYPTLLASDGARHLIANGLLLGASVDSEVDGLPSADADGDDTTGIDDEDGVVFTSLLGRSLIASLEITASAAGKLDAWIDFNADGDWDDTGEQIFTDTPVTTGVNQLSFPVPVSATLGTTSARFRLSTTGGLSPTGLATDGEVEDEQVEILEGPDLEIDMVASPKSSSTLRPVTFVMSVTNNGPVPASTVTVTDTIPAEVVFVSSTPGGPDCSYASGTLTCDLGTLDALDTTWITVETTLDPAASGSLSNTANVSCTEVDPIWANDSVTVVSPIAFFADGFESGDTTGWD